MILFWIIAAAMLLAALALLLPTLLRPKQFVDRDLNQININIAKQRLKELEAEYQAGQHSDAQYQQIQKDLEQQLANDLEKGQAPETAKNIQSSKLVATIIAATVPLLAVTMYLTRGNMDDMDFSGPGAGADSGMNMISKNGTPPTIDEMIATLEEKLAKKPNNPQGWFMLARSYMSLKQYDKSIPAWEKLLDLIGQEEPDVLVQYADALAMTQKGRLAGKPTEQVLKALKLDPNNTQGLWLAGMAMQEQKKDMAALGYWRRLEPNMTDDPESQVALRGLINHAERRLHLKETDFSALPSIASASNKPTANNASAIRLEIDLDPSLAAKVAVEDSLFIYAKALSGPPMPLAAARKKAIDLPLSITLDDSMAMMPQMKLSNFKQVKVGARISKSGNAIAQDGDFYAEVQPVTVGQKGVIKLLIKQVKGQAPVAATAPAATAVLKSDSVAADAVNVTVTLAPNLATQVSPEQSIFIYAKALRGPPMPLAALRKQVKDLPLTLTLNDAMAMMPQMKLSSFKQVKIGARISKSGNAIGQPGDLFGEVQPVTVGQAETVKVVIQHVR